MGKTRSVMYSTDRELGLRYVIIFLQGMKNMIEHSVEVVLLGKLNAAGRHNR